MKSAKICGFGEIPERQRLEIKRIENKEDYMDLLLEADPSEEAVHKYLEKSDVYGLKMGDEIISVAAICPVSANEVELKNLATKEEYRNMGWRLTLHRHVLLFKRFKKEIRV